AARRPRRREHTARVGVVRSRRSGRRALRGSVAGPHRLTTKKGRTPFGWKNCWHGLFLASALSVIVYLTPRSFEVDADGMDQVRQEERHARRALDQMRELRPDALSQGVRVAPSGVPGLRLPLHAARP